MAARSAFLIVIQGTASSSVSFGFREDHLDLVLNQRSILADARIHCCSREAAPAMGGDRMQAMMKVLCIGHRSGMHLVENP